MRSHRLRSAAGYSTGYDNVHDFTTGSAPAGWTDAQMNNTSSTFSQASLASSQLPSGYSFGNMYFQIGRAHV